MLWSAFFLTFSRKHKTTFLKSCIFVVCFGSDIKTTSQLKEPFAHHTPQESANDLSPAVSCSWGGSAGCSGAELNANSACLAPTETVHWNPKLQKTKFKHTVFIKTAINKKQKPFYFIWSTTSQMRGFDMKNVYQTLLASGKLSRVLG